MANIFSNLFNPKPKDVKTTPFKEVGVSGAVSLNGYLLDREKNPKLSYDQRQTRYEEMIKNISIIGAGIRMFTNLGASAKWSFEQSENDASGEYAEWFEKQLEKNSDTWPKVVKHALMYNFLGFSVLEKTAARDANDGAIFWRSIENRPQNTIARWYLDDDGNVFAFGQDAPLSGENLLIPREKCFYIADNLLDDSPAGTGVMRHIFKDGERLEEYLKLENMGFARDLRGVPFARLPLEYINKKVVDGEITQAQATAIIQSMKDTVQMQIKSANTGFLLDSKTYTSKSDTGETVSSVPQYDIGTVQGAAPGLTDMGKAIDRLQSQIARVMGVEGLLLHGGGSNAMSKDKSKNLYMTINGCLNEIAAQTNKDIVKPLFRLNGIDEALAPTMRVEEIDAMDAADVAIILKDLATAGAPLGPDDDAVNEVRAMVGLSPADFDQSIQDALDGE